MFINTYVITTVVPMSALPRNCCLFFLSQDRGCVCCRRWRRLHKGPQRVFSSNSIFPGLLLFLLTSQFLLVSIWSLLTTPGQGNYIRTELKDIGQERELYFFSPLPYFHEIKLQRLQIFSCSSYLLDTEQKLMSHLNWDFKNIFAMSCLFSK